MTSRPSLAIALSCAALATGCDSGCRPKTPVVIPTTTGPATTTSPRTSNKPAPSPEAATIKFTDVTVSAGIDFTYKNDKQKMNRAILESVGGGQGRSEERRV